MLPSRILLASKEISKWAIFIDVNFNNSRKNQTTVAHSLKELLQALVLKEYTFIFIEIDIHNVDKVLAFVKMYKKYKSVILLADDSTYAVQSFDYDAVADYLVFPISENRMFRALTRVHNFSISQLDFTKLPFRFFNTGRFLKRINFDDILYIEAYGIYAKVFGENGFILINESFQNLEEILNSKRFLRVHRSYIINVNKIDNYTKKNLVINTKLIPIGPSFKNNVMIMLKELGAA